MPVGKSIVEGNTIRLESKYVNDIAGVIRALGRRYTPNR